MKIVEVAYDMFGNKIDWKSCVICDELVWTTETDDNKVFCGTYVCLNNKNHTPKLSFKKSKISDGDRWLVWERDNFTCQLCGSRQKLSIDHVLAESKGGESHPDNYQTLCNTCNSRKGGR